MSLVTVRTEIPPQCLDTTGAARFLAVKRGTLAAMRLRGNGPVFIRQGKTVIYDVDDLRAWVKSRRRFRSSAEAES